MFKLGHKVKVGDAFQTKKGVATIEAIVVGTDRHTGYHVEGEIILVYEGGKRTAQLVSRFLGKVANGLYVRLEAAK